jgi:hypothetical protein
MIREDPNLSRTWTRSTLCVLCVCAFVHPAAAWKTRRSSSKYIGQSIFCFGRADLAWVVNLILNSESESLRFEAWRLVTRPLLHQAGSRVRTPGLDNLKWDWHASQGCLQTPDPSSKNVACGAAGASRLMMNASCSFGPGSWVLDGLYVILQKVSHTCGATEALILLSSTKPPQPLP